MPELGPGLVYSAQLEPILEGSASSLIRVLEVEPQTHWLPGRAPTESYRLDRQVFEQLRALPLPKIVHSVTCPLGSARRPDRRNIDPLQETIDVLNAHWVSEHLSFNCAEKRGSSFNAGFLLPPRQSLGGVEGICNTVRAFASNFPVPLLLENGVNYLRADLDEITDSAFVSAVARGGNCGILLDLHNLWTNELNGRESLDCFIDSIPLDLVWEIHLAGGHYYEGHWLDAHSGEIPPELIKRARAIVPRLPNLKAIIFEILPMYVSTFGLDRIQAQLEILNELWTLRQHLPAATGASVDLSRKATLVRGGNWSISPQEWENALGGIVIGESVGGALQSELLQDPGVAVLRALAEDARAGAIVDVLTLTSRVLMINRGAAGFRALLSEYFRQSPPELFASREAEAFGEFLRRQQLRDSYLYEVLAFELGAIRMHVDAIRSVVRFKSDPDTLFAALAKGQLPESPAEGNFEVVLDPCSQHAEENP